jgi:hypothetical protein
MPLAARAGLKVVGNVPRLEVLLCCFEMTVIVRSGLQAKKNPRDSLVGSACLKFCVSTLSLRLFTHHSAQWRILPVMDSQFEIPPAIR